MPGAAETNCYRPEVKNQATVRQQSSVVCILLQQIPSGYLDSYFNLYFQLSLAKSPAFTQH